jgi:hypothetical protein
LRRRYVVIDGCPCNDLIAPYIKIVLEDAGQHAAAIYRGDDPAARPILHAHGKHTQRELANASPAQRRAWGIEGTPNPPGRSQHELKSDGVANPHVPPGEDLELWQQGVDSGNDTEHDKAAVVLAARRHGWHVKHPYNSAVEGHHWCFATRPRPHGLRMRLRVARLRRSLPRH